MKPEPTSVRKSHSLEIQAWFVRQGAKGGTTDECAGALGLMHHAVSAALNRLRRSGQLKITNERRTTRSGRPARVYLWAPIAGQASQKPSRSRDERILTIAKAFVAKRSQVRTEAHYIRIVRTLIKDLSKIALESV